MSRMMSSSISNEDDITLCFQTAREKLDRVNADAKEKKTQIVKDLAKDLEGKIRTDSICNEIVHQLYGKVSERLIRHCLDERYKETHRVENARKQKPHENTKNLAATVPLEQEKPPMQDGKTVIVNDTSSNTEACPIPTNDVNELHDQFKRNGTGTNDNDEERTADADTKEELVKTHSLIGEIEPVNKQSWVDRKENFVSHVPMSFDDLRKDMDTLSQKTKRADNIFFKVSVELRTHMVDIELCGITKRKNRMMISTGKGVLEEAN